MTKADSLKQSREDVFFTRGCERTKSGDWPQRKRGYYRALTRKEEWAVELSKKQGLAWLIAWTYRLGMIRKALQTQNPFLSLIIEEDSKWCGGDFLVPFIKPGPHDEKL